MHCSSQANFSENEHSPIGTQDSTPREKPKGNQNGGREEENQVKIMEFRYQITHFVDEMLVVRPEENMGNSFAFVDG